MKKYLLSNIIFIVCICNLQFFESCSNGTYNNYNKQSEDLRKIGEDINEAIINEDIISIMKYVDKKYGIQFGYENLKTYEDVKKDIMDKKSELYCNLFDSKCLQIIMKSKGNVEWNEYKCVKEYLLYAKKNNLKLFPKINNNLKNKFITGYIVYTWDGKKEEKAYQVGPVFMYPDFIYTEEGWKIIDLFTEY